MSDLTSTEKQKLEKMFEMSGGYVLDFYNSTFREFFRDNFDIDIYDSKYNYRSGSKANLLRAFWRQESNSVVGMLISELLEYWKTTKSLNQQSISTEEDFLFNECINISRRLTANITQKPEENSVRNDQIAVTRAELLARFDEFANLENKQRRGLLLENLLQEAFELYEIETRRGFRRNEGGEQIDGAFKLDGWHYLVECKWTKKFTDIRQLDSLSGKLDRSGKQMLGLFLSMNGWSKNVVPLLKLNQGKSIILMEGYDLRSVLSNPDINLKALLVAKLDHLNFETEPFYGVKQYMEDNGIY